MFKKCFTTCATACIALIFAVPAGASDTNLCPGTLLADVSSAHRGHGGAAAECFTTEISGPGTLMLEVSVPAGSPTEPWLTFLGGRCDATGLSSEAYQVRDELATGVVVGVREPGSYTYCVASQDSRRALGDYRLASSFVASDLFKDDEEDQPEPDPFASGSQCTSFQFKDDEEDQPEPDPFTSGSQCAGFQFKDDEEDQPEPDPFAAGSQCTGFQFKDDEEDQPEPDPFAAGSQCSTAFQFKDDEEDQPEPDPLAAGPQCVVNRVVRALCAQSAADDHGDLLRCATRVRPGHLVAAEIANDWGDDDDFFTFVVERLSSVRISQSGELATRVAIHDRRGYVLSQAEGEPDEVLHLVKTLSPGRYYLRVAGRDGAQGTYGLEVEIEGGER